MEKKTWLTIKEAATHTALSTSYLRKAVRRRLVPHTRLGSELLRFNVGELDRWMQENGGGDALIHRK